MKNLKELFESSVLNEETKTVINEAFDTAVSAKETELKEGFDAQLVEAKAEMKEVYDEAIKEAVAEELEAIAEEVQHARTLEVQYADKLELFKEEYQAKLDETYKASVDEVVKEELDELKEDIEIAKKHQFVLDMFESYRSVYESMFASDEEGENVQEQLEEAKRELGEIKKENKMNELLENVQGRTRDVARTILESVPFEKMEAKFESVLPILLSEEEGSDNKGKPLTESTSEKSDEEVTGTVVMEGQEEETSAAEKARLAKIQRSLRLAHGK